MPTVFVPNIPVRMNPDTREWMPTMNVWAAEKYGEIRVLLAQDELVNGAAFCRPLIAERMSGVGPDDCVLHIGDPAMMAAVVREHMRRMKDAPLHLLKWDKRARDYMKVELL